KKEMNFSKSRLSSALFSIAATKSIKSSLLIVRGSDTCSMEVLPRRRETEGSVSHLATSRKNKGNWHFELLSDFPVTRNKVDAKALNRAERSSMGLPLAI